MYGVIIGDVIGSRFENNNIKTKEFELFDKKCVPTDDSIMSVAICKALLYFDGDYEKLKKRRYQVYEKIWKKISLLWIWVQVLSLGFI